MIFSEAVEPGTNIDGITLIDDDGQTVACSGAVGTGSNANKLYITHGTLTEDETHYTLTVPAGAVKDTGGLPLESSFEAGFTTRDITPPQVVSAPAANTDIGPYDKMVFTFQEITCFASSPELRPYVVQTITVPGIPPTQQEIRTVVNFELIDRNDGATDLIITLGKDSGLLDNYPSTLIFYAGFVRDTYGNENTAYQWSFTTGDLSSPKLVPGESWGTTENLPAIIVSSTTPVIELNFSETLYQGVNFDNIHVEHETKRNLSSSLYSLTGQSFESNLDIAAEKVDLSANAPADIEISGNILRVSITEQPLIPNYLYRIIIPKGALQDENGLETSVSNDVFLTYNTAGNAPQVVWSGSLTNGQLIPGDDPTLSLLNPGAYIGIAFNMPITQNTDVWNNNIGMYCPITLTAADGSKVIITAIRTERLGQ